MARKRTKKPAETDLVGRDGALCLTFVNTGTRRSPRLLDYADLLTWVGTYGALSPADASRLRRLAVGRSEDAAAAFAAAERLHSLLKQIVNAAVDREPPPVLALHALNLLVATLVPRRILVPHGDRVGWDWPPDDPETALCRPLWPIARSAMDLVTSEDCAKVRRCAARGCGVLFLKKGGGRSRVWCSARSCGDPARSRRYYRSVTETVRRFRCADFFNGSVIPFPLKITVGCRALQPMRSNASHTDAIQGTWPTPGFE